MRRRRWRTSIGLLCALAVGGCQPAVQAPPQKPQALVRTQTTQLVDYAPQLSLTGEIRARTETPVAFRVTGRITERLVDVGDHVSAGQVLARIDPQSQQADVTAAQAGVAAAQAQLTQAQATFERQNTLFKQGVIARSQFEQAQTAQQTAQATLDAANAQLGNAQEALGYAELKAAAAGIVTARNLDVSEVAQAAQPVFEIAEDGPRDAVFDVQEALFLQQPKEQAVQIAAVDNPQVTVEGMVRVVSPTLDPRTGTVQVIVGIEQPPAGMALGSAVTGTISAVAQEAYVLPWSALWSQGDQPAVWVVDPQASTVSLTPVTLLAHATGSVIIGAGLQPGQMVVTDGGKLLRPGEEVTVEPEPVK